jgi:glycerate dehydrogenase
MNLVCLDAYTANPGDLSWSALESLASCTMHDRTPPELVIERAQNAEILLTNKAVISRQAIDSLPRLRYIGVLATGYNVVDVAAARERGIPVCNVPGYSSASVAQAVFALLLELTNHTGRHAAAVAAGDWASCADFAFWHKPLHELAGRTMGIVGFGEIGQATARIATAFGMKVLASRRTWALPAPEGVEPASVEDVLSQSDVISLHCPLTDETKQMINAASIAKMRRDAYLINTARGPLIDEAALAAALKDGQIAGAGLDVLSVEPPRGGNPLIDAPNCIITPHVAWASKAARTRLIAAAAGNIHAWQQGQATNVVN